LKQTLLTIQQRPRFNIADLPLVAERSPATLARQLARLRQLAVIKRVAGTYRYYLTRAGRTAIAAGRRLTEHTVIPALT
jgi:DNA-binding HxlR family transcriptional regulator